MAPRAPREPAARFPGPPIPAGGVRGKPSSAGARSAGTMPLKGAHGWIGKQLIDADGIEIGYVSAEDDKFLTIAEGPVGQLRLGRRFVTPSGERLVLNGPAREVFVGLNVVDNQGEFFGVVRDTMEAEDVLDSLVVEDEGGEMVTVLLEDVKAIDEWVDLDVSSDDVYGKQESGG